MKNTPPDNTRRWGRGMMTLAWIVALAGLAIVYGGAVDRRQNPNRQPVTTATAQAIEVSLLRNRQGHYVAEGAINDVSVEMLLDTGASLVSVPEGLARRLNLPRGREMLFDTANGVSRGYRTQLESVRLGGIVLREVEAGVAPGMTGDQVLLGMNFLQTLDLMQSGDTLVVRQRLQQL